MALAFLFPGQGSQKVGMGAELLAERPDLLVARLERAEQTSGLPIGRLCAEGPIEELTRTDAAQPALFALSLAVHELAREAGMRPALVAGHSLGEYTAAVACGALDEADGAALVAERGRLMAAAQHEQPGTMAAIIGLDAAAVVALCEDAAEGEVVAPANFNTPTQVVVSGDVGAVRRVVARATDAGATRAILLHVGAAFHSSLMADVRERLRTRAADLDWRDPEIPLVCNASGSTVTDAEGVREALITQIAAPVRWVDVVRELERQGVSAHVELGPGRTLIGLVRQILAEPTVFAADGPGKLAKATERLRADEHPIAGAEEST